MALGCAKINDNYKKHVSRITHKKEQEKMELEGRLSKKEDKVYSYNISWGKAYPEHIRRQWEIIKPTLARQDYRIEVEKIKAGVFTSKVYYRYIKE